MRQFASRIGRFIVAGEFFNRLAPGEGVNLFVGMVVLETRHHFQTDVVEYLALHEDFRPRDTGEIVPLYRAVFNRETVFPKWEEVTGPERMRGDAFR